MLTRRKALAIGAGLVGAAGVYGGSKIIGSGGTLLPGRSRARPIQTDVELPKTADVVIIGGGNIGTAAAFYLAKNGLKVALCEKGVIGGEGSCRSVGELISVGAPPHKLPFLAKSNALWKDVNAELGVETGYRRDGLILEIKSEQERAFWEGWLKSVKTSVPNARLLSSKEVAATINPSRPWLGAIFNPDDGRAEPTLVSPAFATAARRLGATILQNCAVRGLDMSGGQISGVVTERGLIKARNVILAGGVWSAKFLHNMAVTLPTATVFTYCASVRPTAAGGPAMSGISATTTWRPQLDGGYTTSSLETVYPIVPETFRNWRQTIAAATSAEIGETQFSVNPRLGGLLFDEWMEGSTWRMDEVSPFERRRILEPSVLNGAFDASIPALADSFDAFKGAKPYDIWGGAVANLPDWLPAFGAVPGVSGLVVATAFPEGLTLAPAAGKLLSDVVMGTTLDIDMSIYKPDRF